jgi:chaperone required for assembly of F1-ATPase
VWARDTLGANFRLAEGVVHVAQPDTALRAVAAAIPSDPWRLGALHTVTTLTGSALIALALLRGAVTAEQAWQAAHVDEDWNMEQWGRDELALERRAFRLAEFQAATTVLHTLDG